MMGLPLPAGRPTLIILWVDSVCAAWRELLLKCVFGSSYRKCHMLVSECGSLSYNPAGDGCLVTEINSYH